MNNKSITVFTLLILLVAVGIFFNPFYRIKEGNQVVITRFGEVVKTEKNSGLHLKIPVIDQVIVYPKKILAWDGEKALLPTRENQLIWVDTTARWRIKNPEKFYAAVRTETKAFKNLDAVIDSSVRTVIANNSLSEAVRSTNFLVSFQRPERDNDKTDKADKSGEKGAAVQKKNGGTAAFEQNPVAGEDETEAGYVPIKRGREELSKEIQALVQKVVPQYGIEVLDVVIRRIRYSDALTESVESRMVAERNKFAQGIRADGEGQKEYWNGKLNNDVQRISSEAYEEAQRIKGKADAKAAKIYAEAYSRDPEFYTFWKSMESYKATLPDVKKVLTTDSDYFRYLYREKP